MRDAIDGASCSGRAHAAGPLDDHVFRNVRAFENCAVEFVDVDAANVLNEIPNLFRLGGGRFNPVRYHRVAALVGRRRPSRIQAARTQGPDLVLRLRREMELLRKGRVVQLDRSGANLNLVADGNQRERRQQEKHARWTTKLMNQAENSLFVGSLFLKPPNFEPSCGFSTVATSKPSPPFCRPAAGLEPTFPAIFNHLP